MSTMIFRWMKKYKLESVIGILYVLMLLYYSGIPNVIFFSAEPKIYRYGPVSGQEPAYLFILLHGSNNTGSGTMNIGLHYASHFPDAVFVAPEGPRPALYRPYGHSWFYKWLTPRGKLGERAGEAFPMVQKHIENAMSRYNIPPKKTILAGFSQGGVMALYSSLHMHKNFAAIISYSGYIAGSDIPDIPSLKDMPILLIHGDKDSNVPISEYYRTLQSLQDHDYNVTGKVIHGADHQVDNAMLTSSLPFIQKTLEKTKEP